MSLFSLISRKEFELGTDSSFSSNEVDKMYTYTLIKIHFLKGRVSRLGACL